MVKLEKRFWSKVLLGDNCWEWQASERHGYGIYSYREEGVKKTKNAHRLAFEIWVGIELPPEILVCHSCDNRKCVRPDHLWLGDYQANTADMVRKGRQRCGNKFTVVGAEY